MFDYKLDYNYNWTNNLRLTILFRGLPASHVGLRLGVLIKVLGLVAVFKNSHSRLPECGQALIEEEEKPKLCENNN